MPNAHKINCNGILQTKQRISQDAQVSGHQKRSPWGRDHISTPAHSSSTEKNAAPEPTRASTGRVSVQAHKSGQNHREHLRYRNNTHLNTRVKATISPTWPSRGALFAHCPSVPTELISAFPGAPYLLRGAPFPCVGPRVRTRGVSTIAVFFRAVRWGLALLTH